MKLALIYNVKEPKLQTSAYSHTYRDMFLALMKRFGNVYHVVSDCDAKDIDADVIIVYDIHSSHHIKIEGLADHKAVKYTYFNDPHQKEFKGKYRNGPEVHKLSAKQRVRRAQQRGIDYIICPYKGGYYDYINPHTREQSLLWFPVAPRARNIKVTPLHERKKEILANGHLWQGVNGFKPYEFRSWAYFRPGITFAKHVIASDKIPSGNCYQTWLALYAGSLALCDTYVVPKYLEIPLAGCVCFAQYHKEYVEMGFKDYENCIFVNQANFDTVIRDFKNNPSQYQALANEGRKVALRWTADKFADYIYKHAEKAHGKK